MQLKYKMRINMPLSRIVEKMKIPY